MAGLLAVVDRVGRGVAAGGRGRRCRAGQHSRDVGRDARIYAPADRLKDWPFGPARYVPIEAADFEQLWEAAQMAGAAAPRSSDARITAARYMARLGDEPFLSGEAVLEVVYQGKTPAMVPLDPCGLTIGEAQWIEHAGKPRPAAVGLRPDGTLAVLAEGSGELHFPWSLRGQRGNSGAVAFRIQWPQCISNCLTLDLPGALRPSVDHGIASETSGGREGYRRWQIDCGGYSHVELRLIAAAATGPTVEPMLLRQSLVYDFSLRGVDLSAQVQLDVPEQPLRQIALDLDPELQFVSADGQSHRPLVGRRAGQGRVEPGGPGNSGPGARHGPVLAIGGLGAAMHRQALAVAENPRRGAFGNRETRPCWCRFLC